MILAQKLEKQNDMNNLKKLRLYTLGKRKHQIDKELPVGTKQMRLDVSSLPSGTYVLTYSVNGQIIDSKKFSKK